MGLGIVGGCCPPLHGLVLGLPLLGVTVEFKAMWQLVLVVPVVGGYHPGGGLNSSLPCNLPYCLQPPAQIKGYHVVLWRGKVGPTTPGEHPAWCPREQLGQSSSQLWVAHEADGGRPAGAGPSKMCGSHRAVVMKTKSMSISTIGSPRYLVFRVDIIGCLVSLLFSLFQQRLVGLQPLVPVTPPPEYSSMCCGSYLAGAEAGVHCSASGDLVENMHFVAFAHLLVHDLLCVAEIHQSGDQFGPS